jgi:hypothetical protein
MAGRGTAYPGQLGAFRLNLRAADSSDDRLPWVLALPRPLSVPGRRHYWSRHNGSV